MPEVRRQKTFVCGECKRAWIATGSIQPGFSAHEQVNCPACGNELGSMRSDLGPPTIELWHGEAPVLMMEFGEYRPDACDHCGGEGRIYKHNDPSLGVSLECMMCHGTGSRPQATERGLP